MNTLKKLGLIALVVSLTGCFLDAPIESPEPVSLVPTDALNCANYDGTFGSLDIIINNTESNNYVEAYDSDGNRVYADWVGQMQPFTIFNTDPKSFDRVLDIFVNGFYYTSIKLDGSQDLSPGYTNGKLLTISATNSNGLPMCATVPNINYINVCEPCDGKVKSLTLKYMGIESGATATITDKSGVELASANGISFGALISLTGTAEMSNGKGVLGTNIMLYLDGQLVEEIHTSCSTPLYEGMMIGDFTIVRVSSRNGGIICDTP